MRITTGIYKGRNLGMPKGIRPTQAKARKALFDILGDIEGLSFLELFAGSGAVGLEALSRGAKELALVEQNPECASAIKKNIELLKISPACVFYPLDSQKAIKNFHQSRKSFDLIFLDPPYYKMKVPRSETQIAGNSGSTTSIDSGSLSKKTLQTLGAYDILTPNGLVVAQHFKRENLPEGPGVLRLLRQYRYGSTMLSFFKKSI